MKGLPVILCMLAFCFVSIASVGSYVQDRWIKQTPPIDFSHLVMWKEVSSYSIINCVSKCNNAQCSGCGYQAGDGKCFLYLNRKQVSAWKYVSTVDYYVPESGGLSSEWYDMRQFGQEFAILITTDRYSWNESNTFCIGKGAALLNMDTYDRRQAIRDVFQWIGIQLPVEHWVGLTELEVEGQWYWLNGSPGLSPNFFGPGEPNGFEGLEHCGELISRHVWLNDYYCSSLNKCICELVL